MLLGDVKGAEICLVKGLSEEGTALKQIGFKMSTDLWIKSLDLKMDLSFGSRTFHKG